MVAPKSLLHTVSQHPGTINQFCQRASNWESDTIATVLSGTHVLNRTCELHNVNNITLRGQSEAKAVVQCSHHKESGFEFFNVSLVAISDIEFTGCGSKWTHTIDIYDNIDFSSALLFVNGSNLTATNVTVSNGSSVGIYVGNVMGSVAVDSCRFTNSPTGGIIVQYTPLVTDDVSLTIANTLIMDNGNERDGHGGLLLSLGSQKVRVFIMDTNFTGNQGGYNGGNMGVRFFDCASVAVSRSQFEEGIAKDGGGIKITVGGNCEDADHGHPKLLSIVDSTFTNNTAFDICGGVYIDWRTKVFFLQSNGNAYIDIINSSF